MIPEQMPLQYMNHADCTVSGASILFRAQDQTDFIVSPIRGTVVANAAFAYIDHTGDFVLRAKVTHAFASVYDACALLAYQDEHHWAKACFEASDYHTHAVVTVMTNPYSDDCNGVDVAGNSVWLQLSRKGDVFAVHYSCTGEQYILTRICRLPFSPSLKLGFAAQNPLGGGGKFRFSDCCFEARTLTDIRDGNR